MKIKNLKYIFWFVFSFSVFWFSFTLGQSLGQCSDDMVSWTSGTHLSRCNWTNERYDNRKQLDTFSDKARIFFLMAWISWQPCVETSAWRQRSENIVRSLQQQMQFTVWWACSTCVDWKLWERTLTALESCAALWCDGQTVPTLSGNSLACSGWLEVDNLTHCCVKPSAPPQISYSPVQPTLTDDTAWDWENNKANLTLQFNDPQIYVSWRHVWSNSIATSVWSISNRNENHLGMKITFTVDVWDANSFTINYLSWIITFSWGASSLWWSKTFNRHVECHNPPITWTQDCSNQFWWKWEYSGAIQCCVEWTACANPKNSSWLCDSPLVFDSNWECCVTCTNPVDSSWNCQNWFTPQWWCCLDNWNCQNWYYDENTQCQKCTWDTVPNADRTKCICDSSKKCCWIQLNTVVPFIGDCIEMNSDSSRWDTTSVTSVTAFPILMQWLMKILMSAIMVFSFLMVIVAWLSMTTWAFGWSWFTKWKTILKNVIISLILLWCSWLILSLINPNFFGG